MDSPAAAPVSLVRRLKGRLGAERRRVPVRRRGLARSTREGATRGAGGRRWRVASTLVVGTVCVGLVGGCGGDTHSQGGSAITIESTAPDSLDPALAYSIAGLQPNWLVYTPLLTYRRASGQEGAELVPGVADSMPQVSADGRTYRLRIRPGLLYSDGTPVKASDFAYTIRRLLTLRSPGSSFYMNIVGADAYVKERQPSADISGITADDRARSITIRLISPDGTFPYVLALSFGGLVSAATPMRNLTTSPPPGVGPFMITKAVPNREFVLKKNPRFNIPGIPSAHLDTVTTKIVKSLTRQAEDVTANRSDFMEEPPPADLLSEVRDRYGDRFREHVVNATSYLFLNVRLKPFDNAKVREAVNLAVDKRAVQRLYGGLFSPTCNFLPPNMLGYHRIDPCPWGDPNGTPDVARAKQLIREAGAQGAPVTVWGTDQDPDPKVVQYYADLLNTLGLKATPRTISFSIFLQTVGNARTGAQTGLVNWAQDFPHPADFMFLVSGKTITPTGNPNFGDVADPVLTNGIERLKRAPDLRATADQWATLDRLLVQRAYVVPLGDLKRTTFMSSRMNIAECERFNPVYFDDYSSFCTK
jgi:peptide/nickel transport system substrate-binding protein